MKTCKHKNCSRPLLALGFCNAHYKRFKDNRPMDPPIQNKGKGWIGISGYHFITKNRKTIRVHRLIMEKYLGRPLLPTEHIHHINGKKTDNRIENMKIMSNSDHLKEHWRNSGFREKMSKRYST